VTFFEVNGIRLHFRLDGSAEGPPLLLSNSLGADVHMWDAQVPALSPRYRVVRYDGRGHGASGFSAGPYDLDLLGRDALGLLDHLDIERAHICGVSMGGLVALWLSVHHPERVASAVFANTAAKIGTPDTWGERISIVEKKGMPGIRDFLLERFFTSGLVERDPETVERVGRTLVEMPPDAYVASCRAVEGADLRREVETIRAPSLIVASTEDRSTPLADSEWLHARIPNSRLVVIERAAHLSNVEQPGRFNEAVVSFLEGADRG
jgi:3-oxoadipate enol-lactonase